MSLNVFIVFAFFCILTGSFAAFGKRLISGSDLFWLWIVENRFGEEVRKDQNVSLSVMQPGPSFYYRQHIPIASQAKCGTL